MHRPRISPWRDRRIALRPPKWLKFVLSAGALTLGAGCAEPEQGPECRAFVACVGAADAERGTQTNVDRFLPDGACWDGVKGAAVCESSCRRGIPVLRKQEPNITCEVTP